MVVSLYLLSYIGDVDIKSFLSDFWIFSILGSIFLLSWEVLALVIVSIFDLKSLLSNVVIVLEFWFDLIYFFKISKLVAVSIFGSAIVKVLFFFDCSSSLTFEVIL